MELPIGTSLQNGKYKICKTLGHGGFGITYLAEHCIIHEKVALKEFFINNKCSRLNYSLDNNNTVIWERGVDRSYLLSFIREVKALWHLRQSHIVHVMDFFIENNTTYYVMEYIHGKNLRNIIRDKGPLPEDVAVSYIRQVAKGLVYMHKKRRLHLDIKPENIIVDRKGYAYIIDFGTNIHLDKEGLPTQGSKSKPPMYSYHYSSIEVEESIPSPTAAADVYSLGATLYFLLTGTNPADAYDRMKGVEHLKPLPETISPALREIVKKAMRKNAKNRYHSMDLFLKQLKSLEK